MEVKFNEEIALAVFKIVGDLWREKKGIFENIVLPQERYMPAIYNDKDYANWLFYAALPMRGGLISEDPFKWLLALWEKFPEMFDPKIVSEKWSPDKIGEAFKVVTPAILNGNGTGEKGGAGALSYKMGEHSKAWYENSLSLHRYWGGDIRNVFWGVTDFEEAFRRIDYYHTEVGFKGMRRKIFSLLVIWLQEKKFIPIFPTPIPIDFHALRVMIATDVIRFEEVAKPFVCKNPKHPLQLEGKLSLRIAERFIDAVAKWTQKFIWGNGLSHLDVNPAVWVLSRNLCAEHFQSLARGGRKSFVESNDLSMNSWPKTYKNPCGYCPIENYCKWIIPSAPYYQWGLLIRLGKRVAYPINQLPGIDWTRFIPYKPRKNSRR